MAQFDFLGTWTDSWLILHALLEPGDILLVADMDYDRPEPLFVRTVEEAQEEPLRARSWYLWSEQFSKHPPFLERMELEDNQEQYWVNVSTAGPLLQLVLPGCYRYDAAGVAVHAFDGGPGLHLAPGMLSHQREYLDPQTQTWERASAAVKAGYKEVLHRMKTKLVRHRFHVPIWTGRDALREVQENRARIHGFGRN
jgi:hypothetical protein